MKNGVETQVPTASFFHWSDEMSVGVRALDSQHRMLIGLTNMLTMAMLTGKGQERQRAVVDAMLDYAAVHFDTEESYMREFGFEGYEEHRLEHVEFASKARELKARSESGRFTLTLEILDYLSAWLNRHIRHRDQEYEELFRIHGLR